MIHPMIDRFTWYNPYWVLLLRTFVSMHPILLTDYSGVIGMQATDVTQNIPIDAQLQNVYKIIMKCPLDE